ncbi:MAG: FapA family protein [Lachnospiraceae bacterium]|nr:FapA family protein [Lachnospiraceae bacterium]
MRNGYFQIGCTPNGTILKVFKPKDGGLQADPKEITEYLSNNQVMYSAPSINQGLNVLATSDKDNQLILLNKDLISEIDESYVLRSSADKMTLTARFYPPSMKGRRLPLAEILNDLSFKGVKHGIKQDVLEQFVKEPRYCEDIVVAEGTPVVQGEHARIEYYFETDLSTKPTLSEDGSVDFFNLKTFTQCKKGDILARLIPQKEGTPGTTVFGDSVKPLDVKRAALKYGRNIACSEDGKVLTAEVNGHVSLVDDKVFLSDVMELDNVGTATGNIEYEGSVVVLGNVCENFSVKAKGNIEVRGVVEGAYIESESDIIIARGMNGMGKGVLKAGNNVIVKFLENAEVSAGGYVAADSILHCKVNAGTEITVSGKRGFITGGHVCARSLIAVKTLGSEMGADTIVEVGVDPKIKARVQEIQKKVQDNKKSLEQSEPVLANFIKKMQSGVPLSKDQKMYMQTLLEESKIKKAELEELTTEYDSYQDILEGSNDARIQVTGDVYAGTKIVISDASMVVKSTMKYCQFKKVAGDVKMTAL